MTLPARKPLTFFNLHGHTCFSFGDGFGTPEEHVARAAELGYAGLAATEHGNVSSHVQLEKHALAAGLVPVFGLEAYTGSTDPETRQQYKYHLTLLARTNAGYRNLNRLVSQSWKEAYYHPTVGSSNLLRHSAGLACLSGCTGSLLACALVGGKGLASHEDSSGHIVPDYNGAWEIIQWFLSVFGENYYLEVQPFWELEKTSTINPAYELLSKETGVPLVVTHDVHYPRPEDGEMQAILHSVHRGKHSIDDALREWNYEVSMSLPESDNDLYYKLRKTGLSRDASVEAIENSARIAAGCRVKLPKAERLHYPIGEEDMQPW
jgi:DNA polymerase-3 subunit alpha